MDNNQEFKKKYDIVIEEVNTLENLTSQNSSQFTLLSLGEFSEKSLKKSECLSNSFLSKQLDQLKQDISRIQFRVENQMETLKINKFIEIEDLENRIKMKIKEDRQPKVPKISPNCFSSVCIIA